MSVSTDQVQWELHVITTKPIVISLYLMRERFSKSMDILKYGGDCKIQDELVVLL